MLLRFILSTLLVGIVLPAWGHTPEEDQVEITASRAACEMTYQLVIGKSYEVECGELFQHYNIPTRTVYKPQNSKVKIANFNLYYPGSYKTAFKDFTLMAKMMNRWDVIGVQELVNVMGQDAKHNSDVLKFLGAGQTLIDSYQTKIQDSEGEVRAEWEQKLITLENDLKKAPGLYRAPGYLKLLNELRKLDKSWSLIVTPRAEAAEATHVQELSGFFYRARRVKLHSNPHCREAYNESEQMQAACLPNLRESFMGRDVGQIFSRRPFLASFESAGFRFNLLTSHIVFTSPSDPEKMAKILMPSFGVSNYLELGAGATKAKYARFAELKVILEFMERYRKNYRDSKLIYLGDTNIEKANPFWPKVLDAYPGSDVFIETQTTLTQRRYTYSGAETYGLASNYDHFIFNPKHVTECNDERGVPNASTFNYLQQPFIGQITDKYLIRDDFAERLIKEEQDDDNFDDTPLGLDADYEANPSYVYRRDNLIHHYDEELKTILTVKNNRIVWDDYRYQEMLEVFERRMFSEQLYDRTYYRFAIEAMSDHLPIVLDCKTALAN